MLAAWSASLLGLLVILAVPGQAAGLPLPLSGAAAWLAEANRAFDADWLARPSFHVVWTVLAAYCLRQRHPRLSPVGAAISVVIAVSCLLTGSHALVDVLAGALLAVLCWHQAELWRRLVGWAENLANSWTAVRLGPLRVINHVAWSGLAAAVGVWCVAWLTGPTLLGPAMVVFALALLAAGAWGYWLEGGSRLARPFGYYGFLLGAMAGMEALAWIDPGVAWTLAAAFACGAPLAQAIGRLRCLVQGCCHGRPVADAAGIRVSHPMSRVTALGGLRGVAIHPTQLYSIAANTVIFAGLWRLWQLGAPASFIAGLYLVLSSLARFVEEQYRGEPQTARWGGLAVYQWLAVVLFVAGIGLSMFASPPVQPAGALNWSGGWAAIGAGLLAAFCMSVDFPDSRRRFSRLTVGEA